MSSVKPERSLAVRYPEIAAMWHPTKNPDWTPHTTSAASDVQVWWVCPDGHEWSEPVRNRVALRKWKRDRIDACGLCLGYHVLQECRCGRRRMVKAAAQSAEYECWACQSAKARERQLFEREREQFRTDYVADIAECHALLDSIVPAGMPAALATEWHREYTMRLCRAMEDERGYGKVGTVGAIDHARHRIQHEADPLPSIEQLRAAHAAGDPVLFMGRRFWTQGMLHAFGLEVRGRSQRGASVVSLERWVRTGVSRVVNRRHPQESHSTTAITRLITDLVEQWGQHDETGPWRSFLELTPPFVPTTGFGCGFIDAVLTRAGSPDLVVEIDSTHSIRSMEKLQFAHTAGATAVWIRWNYGAARKVAGVHVINLIDQTKRPSLPGKIEPRKTVSPPSRPPAPSTSSTSVACPESTSTPTATPSQGRRRPRPRR